MPKLLGEGDGSSKIVKPNVRTGQPYRGSSPAAADYLGQSTAFKKENVEARPAYTGSKLGNEIALNVGTGGPGTGRTTHHCGSQGTHGPVAGQPRPATPDILSQFGPEKRKG